MIMEQDVMAPNDGTPFACHQVHNLIAIVGCDGTGKSTLSNDLVDLLNGHQPTEKHYLGLVSGETGDKIKAWPWIGNWLERRLANKTAKEQSRRNQAPMTGLVATIMFMFSVWRSHKLKRICQLAQGNTLIIADRFPQNEIKGFHYDGPGLSPERVKGRWQRYLMHRESQIYQDLSRIHPELIIRLNIDLATARSRKPDHSSQELADKISAMPRLDYNGARILDIDARDSYQSVLETAYRAILEVALVSQTGDDINYSLD